MTEVLHSPSPSSSPSPSISPQPHNGALYQTRSRRVLGGEEGEIEGVSIVTVVQEAESDTEEDRDLKERENKETRDHHLSLLALLVTLVRKSFWMACNTTTTTTGREELCGRPSGTGVMEIGWPTDVRHVSHVTFDRFNGFLGLPVEFEPEVPRRAPSASTTVFGVSTDSMQLSFDSRGNSVPTILLLMQQRLYAQGGLQAEGIFRINAENSQEEYVRGQLNMGIVPNGIDVHCLAGLIKAWFRELPTGVLDPLSSEQVIQCQSEEECAALVRLLPSSEAALLDWAINLMADVVQMEHLNKMNARNVAMVFAPNMTQMADPLNALMYAVQVMNFLKALIERALKEREDSLVGQASASNPEPSNGNGHQSPQLQLDDASQYDEETERVFIAGEPEADSGTDSNLVVGTSDEEYLYQSASSETEDGVGSCGTHSSSSYTLTNLREPSLLVKGLAGICTEENVSEYKLGQASDCSQTNSTKKMDEQQQTVVNQAILTDNNKSKGISNLRRINSITERIEAWR